MKEEIFMKFLTIVFLTLSLQNMALADDKDDVKKGEFLKKELDLSDDQLTKFKAIKKELRPEIKETRKTIASLRKEFSEAMKDPKISSDDLKKKFEKVQESKSQLQQKMFTFMLRMREVLTPEQMAKFDDVRSRMKKKWKKHYKQDCDE